jgi:hypothetical protein
MPVLARISAASIGGSVTSLGTAAPGRGIMAVAKPATGTPTYIVPREQLVLLERAAIHPGDDSGTIDRKLQTSGLSITERLACKAVIARCGLIPR